MTTPNADPPRRRPQDSKADPKGSGPVHKYHQQRTQELQKSDELEDRVRFHRFGI